jgi:hypothetical protein
VVWPAGHTTSSNKPLTSTGTWVCGSGQERGHTRQLCRAPPAVPNEHDYLTRGAATHSPARARARARAQAQVLVRVQTWTHPCPGTSACGELWAGSSKRAQCACSSGQRLVIALPRITRSWQEAVQASAGLGQGPQEEHRPPRSGVCSWGGRCLTTAKLPGQQPRHHRSPASPALTEATASSSRQATWTRCILGAGRCRISG